MKQKQLAVFGGGAAGFFAAIRAAEQGFKGKITLFEKSSKCLEKVRISGGGRCNVTHHCFKNSELLQAYPRGKKILKQAFNLFSVKETIEWFEKNGVKLKVEEDGRMFPISDNSEDVILLFMQKIKEYEIELVLRAPLTELIPKNHQWICKVGQIQLNADAVILALGGMPKSIHYDFLRKHQIAIEEPLPSLFTYQIADKKLQELTGLSVKNTKIKLEGFGDWVEGAVLVTHWGLSGPAILRSSAEWAREVNKRAYQFTIFINWVGREMDEVMQLIQEISVSSKIIKNLNPEYIPQRLWEYIVTRAGISLQSKGINLNKVEKNKITEELFQGKYEVKGKSTFKEEFVTAGGVSETEINKYSMQLNKLNGIFVCGEMVNIDGITGGFNFQAAWSTANLAANAAKNFLMEK